MVETLRASSTSSMTFTIASTGIATHAMRAKSFTAKSVTKNGAILRLLFSHLSWLTLATPLNLSPTTLLGLSSNLLPKPPLHGL